MVLKVVRSFLLIIISFIFEVIMFNSLFLQSCSTSWPFHGVHLGIEHYPLLGVSGYSFIFFFQSVNEDGSRIYVEQKCGQQTSLLDHDICRYASFFGVNKY